MRHVPAQLRRFVLLRSGERCEYCQLSQAGQEAAFHIDHIRPGCGRRRYRCRESRVGLYVWSEHFRWDGVRVVGLTATARATIEILALNRPLILAIRLEETMLGRHPL
jgi:hypothetical protein